MSRSNKVIRMTGFVLGLIWFASGNAHAQSSLPPVSPRDPSFGQDVDALDRGAGEGETVSQAWGEDTSGQIVTDGEVMLQVDAQPRRVQIAESIEIQLLLEAPTQTLVTFPQFGDAIGELNVLRVDSVTSLPVDGDPGRRQWSSSLIVDSLQPGTFQIPEMEVAYRLRGPDANTLATRVIRSLPLSVAVEGSVPEGQDRKDFRGIKGTLLSPEADIPNSNWKWWIGGLLFAACGVVLVVARNRLQREPEPRAWALSEIKRIEGETQSGAIQGGQAYVEASRVIRTFIEFELGIESTTMSTAELRQRMLEHGMDSGVVASTVQLLEDADEVKFSGRDFPARHSGDNPTDSARHLVQLLSTHTNAKRPGGGD